MIKTFKDPKLMKMVMDICGEHWEVSKLNDGNIGYLWYMYTVGTKQGTFKPFIFFAELNLLLKTGYITEVEKDNMIRMLDSLDEDSKILVIDDICDSSKTMQHIKEKIGNRFKLVRYVTLFSREKSKHVVDHYGVTVKDGTWLVFPWEK